MKLLLISLLLPLNVFAANLEYVTDLHAGPKKQRVNGGDNIVYPKKANLAFKQFLKRSTADAVIVLGDSVNGHEKEYAKKLRKSEKKYGKNVIWVKGNHDGHAFSVLHGQTYYTTTIKDQYIIILDTTSTGDKLLGGISADQMTWFLSVYSPSAVIVMHHPPIDQSGNILPQFAEFMAISEKNEIHAGHWHKVATFDNIHVHYPLTSR